MPKKQKSVQTENGTITEVDEIKTQQESQNQTNFQQPQTQPNFQQSQMQPNFQQAPQQGQAFVAPNKATVLYDQNGNPVFIQPVQNSVQNPEAELERKNKKRKVGPFVASLITCVLSFVFLGLAVLFYFQFMSGSTNDASAVALFLIYMFTGIGLITFIPGFGLSISALVCSCLSIKSSVKAIKIISIFVLIFSIIALIVSVAMPFFIPYVFEATVSPSSSTASVLL